MGDAAVNFEEVFDHALAMLQRRGRVTYQMFQLQFELDDKRLEALKDALLFAHTEITDAGGRGLVWTGEVPIPNSQPETDSETRFHLLLRAVTGLVQREKRVPYRTLKYVFGIDDGLLAEIRDNLRFRQLAQDEDGEGLVWTGETAAPDPPTAAMVPNQPAPSETPAGPSGMVPAPLPLDTPTVTETNGPSAAPEFATTDVSDDESVSVPESVHRGPEAERRQLTVMFCDLVGSTDLSGKLDPEHLREVVKAYQERSAGVIHRYAGHIAQYLGDGLLIYFGFPVAHEDDAQRAVYTALEIPEAMAELNTRLKTDYGVELAVRIGIHTGPVVVGEMGGGGRHENLALGETPNIAARLEGLAPANTAVISPVTAQLVQRAFMLEELGPHALKGVAEPMILYAVVSPREDGDDDHGNLLSGGFDALVGRDEEIGLLLRRWEQSKEGLGQVVMLSGEAGIGKSSLVEGLRDYVHQAGFTRITYRCSPYHTNSAFYPIIEHIQRALGWLPEDTADMQLVKLEQALGASSLSLEETVPLMAPLLSLRLPEGRYPILGLSPAQQRQQTQDVLMTWLLEEAERQAVLTVWEDLHWADPSTLDALGLLVEQVPTAKMLLVLTFRPEFDSTWPTRSHLTPITLNRLERPQVEGLIVRLAGDKALPAEVVEHIVTKTDGVPLYVEELTKMLLASELLREEDETYVLTGPLLTVAIPDTLQDSLMARLDQMDRAKEVAQLGAVLGREFGYEMLQAISSQDDETLQSGLVQLVAAELLYQRGRPPRAKYIFKHALIQDAAYASLLRSTRQQVHHQIAQLTEDRFPEIVESHPELVAHHYTEAGLNVQAIPYWEQAGKRASERWGNIEAVSHLTKGLQLLTALPQTPECISQELAMQLTLGPALMATKGYAAPEVQHSYARARELCSHMSDTPQLFPILMGLCRFYYAGGVMQTARELGEDLLALAHHNHDASWLVVAHTALGTTLCFMGEFSEARGHLEQGLAHLLPPQEELAMARLWSTVPRVQCLIWEAYALLMLGYPEQALHKSREAHSLSQELGHPHSVVYILFQTARLHLLRWEIRVAKDLAETAIGLATEQGSTLWAAASRFIRGFTRVAEGEPEEGLAEMSQSMTTVLATGAGVFRPMFLVWLAEAYKQLGQAGEGLSLLAEAQTVVDESGQRYNESELYHLKGELLLQQAVPDISEATTCFHHALGIARHQQAKYLELRAATSLAKLWQHQDKRQDAYDLLAPVYSWFAEGFDTADLKHAKVLLKELEG